MTVDEGLSPTSLSPSLLDGSEDLHQPQAGGRRRTGKRRTGKRRTGKRRTGRRRRSRGGGEAKPKGLSGGKRRKSRSARRRK
jgi:hypothetical protein